MTSYRTGNHWGVTIVREPRQDGCPETVHQGALSTWCGKGAGGICPLHGSFKPDPAQLVAVVVNGDQALAERICALLNGHAIALAAVDYPHRCPGCGNHFRTAAAATECDADHQGSRAARRPRGDA